LRVIKGHSGVLASHGVASETSFQIKTNAQAFRILSSGLYSDKISAVLREIGCNAADAHVAAGCPDRPIEVKLPSPLDSSFYIKDWGTGLTHEEVIGLYTTYFSSNKGDSNEFTGAFGLGSKSPFSYTDSFSITVAKNGKKRFYVAHIGEEGSPVITMLGEEVPSDPDWPNGMMVSFPVKPADVREFHSKAQAVFRWFRVKPVLLGGEPIEEPEFAIQGSNFRLGPKNPEDQTARVIMGNVAYPINAAQLGASDPVHLALISAGLHIEVPIGAVMPTASREELEYDPHTRETLLRALDEVRDEFASGLYRQATSPMPSEWERHTRMQALARSLPRPISEIIDRLLSYAIRDPAEYSRVVALFTEPSCRLPSWVGSQEEVTPGSTQCLVHLYRLGYRKGTVSRRPVVGGEVRDGDRPKQAFLPYDHEVQVVVDNAPHTHERLRAYVLGAHNRLLLLVTPRDGDKQDAAQRLAEHIAAAVGGLPVRMSEDFALPATLKARNSKAKGKILTHLDFSNELVLYRDMTTNAYGALSCTSKRTLGDIPETGRFYILQARRRGRYETRIDGQSNEFQDHQVQGIFRAYRRLCALGIPLPKITGVAVLSPDKVKAFRLAQGGWQDAFKALYEALASKPVQEALRQRVTNLPLISLEKRYYDHEVQGFIPFFAVEANQNTELWKAMVPVLEGYPELLEQILLLKEVNQTTSPKRAGREELRYLKRCWPGICKVLKPLELMELSDLEEKVGKRYPFTVCFNGAAFHKAYKVSAETAAHYLRMILQGPKPVSVRKTTNADDAQSTVQQNQLPLVLAV